MSVPLSASGITLARRSSTSSVVLASAGPSLAIALKYAVVPALSIWMGVTAATSAAAETSFCSVASRGSPARASGEAEPELPAEPPPGGGCAGVPSVTAISSGPFTPAPKFFASRS